MYAVIKNLMNGDKREVTASERAEALAGELQAGGGEGMRPPSHYGLIMKVVVHPYLDGVKCRLA